MYTMLFLYASLKKIIYTATTRYTMKYIHVLSLIMIITAQTIGASAISKQTPEKGRFIKRDLETSQLIANYFSVDDSLQKEPVRSRRILEKAIGYFTKRLHIQKIPETSRLGFLEKIDQAKLIYKKILSHKNYECIWNNAFRLQNLVLIFNNKIEGSNKVLFLPQKQRATIFYKASDPHTFRRIEHENLFAHEKDPREQKPIMLPDITPIPELSKAEFHIATEEELLNAPN